MRSVIVRPFPLVDSPFAGASLNPGDFPLRSNRSRAAARAMLAGKRAIFERREVIICHGRNARAPHATEWVENANERTIGRVVSIPEGMTVAEGLRALKGYAEGEIAQVAELHPEPMNAGTMLMMRR